MSDSADELTALTEELGLYDNLAYIRHVYNVPAKLGGRVQLGDGFSGELRGRLGTITDAHGQCLRIRLDGDMEHYSRPFHPTWELTYLDGGGHE